ncbi:hypothetical protein THOM_1916 [Trachipleistophora hominis]|uniref:Uncharacterized protein n=1 Tax=Trachipleistophora hominis TaxID=72359 RepID=L7JUW0_TRAHO|nr:hypothetical protein THOM_1916 [Trachipleistophora hominis]
MFDYSTTSKESISAHGYNKIDEEKIVNTYIQLREVNCRIHDDEENKKLSNHIMNILI